MRSRHTSITAEAVATMRVIASKSPTAVLDPGDGLSEALLGRPAKWVARGVCKLAGWTPVGARALLAAGGHLVDHLALRTCVIDRALEDGLSAGARQLVILGAGLDARAYRLDFLAASSVFEVDYPSTQAAKRARVKQLTPRCKSLKHVAVDFNVDDLGQALEAAGHDANEPSVVICEGVFPYLDQTAVAETLSVMSKRMTAGRFIASYLPTGQVLPRHLQPLARVSLGVLGEPLGKSWTEQEFAQCAAQNGFVSVSDRAPEGWAAEAGVSLGHRAYDYERLAVLQRIQTASAVAPSPRSDKPESVPESP